MNALDILIIVILAYCTLAGLFRGLIREIAAVVGVFAGFFFAYTYYKEAAEYLSQWISDPAYLNILGFLAAFSGVYTLVWLVGFLFRKIVEEALGKWIDRLTGALMGAVKAILIISVLLVAFVAFLPENAAVIKNSKMTPHIIWASEQLVNLVPPELKKIFSQKVVQIKEKWKKIQPK
jgi:membrane protein required for colicin V production